MNKIIAAIPHGMVATIIITVFLAGSSCGERGSVSTPQGKLKDLQKEINKLKTEVARLQFEIRQFEDEDLPTRTDRLAVQQKIKEIWEAISGLRDKRDKLEEAATRSGVPPN